MHVLTAIMVYLVSRDICERMTEGLSITQFECLALREISECEFSTSDSCNEDRCFKIVDSIAMKSLACLCIPANILYHLRTRHSLQPGSIIRIEIQFRFKSTCSHSMFEQIAS